MGGEEGDDGFVDGSPDNGSVHGRGQGGGEDRLLCITPLDLKDLEARGEMEKGGGQRDGRDGETLQALHLSDPVGPQGRDGVDAQRTDCRFLKFGYSWRRLSTDPNIQPQRMICVLDNAKKLKNMLCVPL